MANKLTIPDLLEAKHSGRKIASISCYDYTTARHVVDAGMDMILVGDSAAQLMLGHSSTLPATMDFMVAITSAVRRAAPDTCLVADMPFLSYQPSISEALKNAGRFVVEASADIVKIEITRTYLDVIKAVSDAGIAVMAHIGIRPQSIGKLGKFKAEGTTSLLAVDLIEFADDLVEAGAALLLLEGVAREVAKIITERVEVPVISCGSGPDCDGQVLVAPDVLGLLGKKGPKFAKSFADLSGESVKAFSEYVEQVHTGVFPEDGHCFHVKSGELEKLQQALRSMEI
jgi:3-methyl-2-oxobutanoate hydroxymethyltransferase